MKIRYFLLRSALSAAAILAAISLPAAAASITTTTGDNDGASGAMFNVTVGGNSLSVTSLDFYDSSTSALTLDVYIKSGSYVGFDNTPASWTLVSSTAVATGNGSTSLTPVNVTPFTLNANASYGVYITFTTTSSPPNMLYTRGSNSYSNSNLSLSLGEGLQGLFGEISPGVQGDFYDGRTWDGTINYTVLNTSPTPEPATWALFALAAPGALFLRRRYLRKY